MSLSNTYLQFDEKKLFKKVLDAAAAQLNNSIKRVVPKIQSEIADLVAQYVSECPEVQSMRGGDLQAELGFISPEHFINGLLAGIKGSVYVEFTPYKVVINSFVGGLSVNVFPEGFREILLLEVATYPSNGYTIPWLQWLLEAGTDIVVADYRIEYGNFPNSRSKMAHMTSGGSYSIPAQYAGRPNDNFITRALDRPDVENRFGDILERVIQESLDA